MKTSYPYFSVLDSDLSNMTEEQIKTIVSANWFETPKSRRRNVILVNLNEFNSETQDLIGENSPIDWGIKDVEKATVIEDVLKRWNIKDGFFLAKAIKRKQYEN